MPALRLLPPPSLAILQRRQNPFRGPDPVSVSADNGSHLFRGARMSASAPLLRDGWARSFGTVEALRGPDKGGNLEGTIGNGSSQEEDEEKGAVVKGEKKSRVTQQRAASGGSSTVERRPSGGIFDASPEGSLELLTIPGVGPRNLRKLVDKGFEGVAQLKQLYIDKVVLPIDLILAVFVRAVHEANWMNEMEISIYDSWFDPVVPALILDCEPNIDFSKDIEAKRQ
ncbi:hypothetical protein BHE74_00027042 [Ensete ventricosum]|nr:hypothetical protein GW17_00043613 [Ensete ventricosum]RWW65641.1 hypothetical protein BHE74_00027042 [Ensete ventricosum]